MFKQAYCRYAERCYAPLFKILLEHHFFPGMLKCSGTCITINDYEDMLVQTQITFCVCVWGGGGERGLSTYHPPQPLPFLTTVPSPSPFLLLLCGRHLKIVVVHYAAHSLDNRPHTFTLLVPTEDGVEGSHSQNAHRVR